MRCGDFFYGAFCSCKSKQKRRCSLCVYLHEHALFRKFPLQHRCKELNRLGRRSMETSTPTTTALPAVIGHRGANAVAPENTLAAIHAAKNLGCVSLRCPFCRDCGMEGMSR